MKGYFSVREVLRHLELLEFVAAEDDQAAGLVLRDHGLEEMLAERTGAAGDQHRLVVEIEPWLGEIAQTCERARVERMRSHWRDGESGRAHAGFLFDQGQSRYGKLRLT